MARRGAPLKQGSKYFSLDVHFYSDPKLIRLTDEFGPIAIAAYTVVTAIVYQCGSYAELSREELIHQVRFHTGCSERISSGKKSVVAHVIDRMASLGLLDAESLADGLVTSRSMQTDVLEAYRRMRRHINPEDFWLLDDFQGSDEEPKKENSASGMFEESQNTINSEENRINAEENRINAEENTPKKKEKESKLNKTPTLAASAAAEPPFFESEQLNRIFLAWVEKREEAGGLKTMTDVKLAALQLKSLSDDPEDILQSALAAALGNWKTFRLRKSGKGKKTEASNASGIKNGVGNFGAYNQRKFDYREAEAIKMGYKQA